MMCGDQSRAEDLAQETFIRALSAWERRTTDNEFAWLYGILVRVHREQNRTFARAARRVEAWFRRARLFRRTMDDPATRIIGEEMQASLWSSVAQLPAAQHQAIVLRFACDLSYREIATVAGCSQGTVKSRIHYGLRALRAVMNPEDREPFEEPWSRCPSGLTTIE